MAIEVVFLHFNDVYHISNTDNVARFLTQLELYRRQYSDSSPLTVFSGDIFSPSLEASILRGGHMLPLLKEIRVDIGCYGNHDFDFGEARLCELAAGTHFPWLLSNVVRTGDDAGDGELLAGAQRWHVTTINGVKLGFFGLAGTDWPSNCRELPPCRILPPVDVARQCSRHLRIVEKCHVVIGVTHMRLIEDVEVSEALRIGPQDERVDLILGGHDHCLLRRYGGEMGPRAVDPDVADCEIVKNGSEDNRSRGHIRIVKSGSDWTGLSCVKLRLRHAKDPKIEQVLVEQVADVRKQDLDPTLVARNRKRVVKCLQGVNARIGELGREPLLHTSVALDGTGSSVRSQESNLGNMLADMVRAFYGVDIALVNGGSIRCDKLVPATGSEPLTVRDLIEMLPFNNALMVKRVTAAALWEALENSFSDAHTDGRFLHYAGFSVVADWSRPEGSRVLEAWHHPSDSNRPPRRIRRDEETAFTVAMAAFIADGFDGYASLCGQETLVAEEGAITDTQLLLRTLGYTPDGAKPEQDVSDDDERRIRRARQAIVKGSLAGLPVVAPGVEDRIVTKGRVV
ncbi:hypothetical protein HIM_05239 [Hirsutella minnesotensis 3608]|uniref:Uncharacterized protein n=1 Tax=Hirsutella minnesotensis 3608 TaxID=1043627 RepID=A0A0F7ZUR3_9HYPO|nr:hypothetical protein HIM_05239 [Hirsutella minnesotensis 3608]